MVEPMLKPSIRLCPCGCGVEARPKSNRAGHVYGCTCHRCDRGLARTRPKPKRTVDEAKTYEDNCKQRLSKAMYRCELALAPCLGDATHCHHFRPQRDGVDDSVANLRACCWPCNNQVEQLGRVTAARQGVSAPRYPDPEDTGDTP